MSELIYITGHRNPDTDSICSVIAYAEFKNKTQNIPAVPVRLGEINRETKFILDYFGVEAPDIINTVKLQVSDLSIDKTAPVSPDISIKMAWTLLKKNEVKSLPVTNDNNNLIGIVSSSSLISTFIDVWDNNILSKSNTKIENIIDTLSAKAVYISDDNVHLKGKTIITSTNISNLSEVVEKGDIVICGDSSEIQKLVIEAGSALLIITDSRNVDEDTIHLAGTNKCAIITTPFDVFTTARLITQSVPVSYVMTRDNIVTFDTDDFVDDIREIMLETRYRSYPVIDENDRVVGSISRYHLISQNRKKVILMDHNEKSQSVHGLEEAEILEIIDHHRVADVQTGSPIYFRNEPVGSTSTIVASIFFENGIRPSKKAAGLLSAAIISDTLLFKSPTTTNIDKMMLRRLASIAEIDVEKFAKEMFKAGTSLSGKSPEDVFHGDFKVFSLNGIKVGVSQVATMDVESFEPMRKDIVSFMDKKANENNFNLLILMLTNILDGGSELIVSGEEKEIVNFAFNTKLEGNSVYLPGVISRKKQVIPPLTSAITNMSKN